MNRDVRVERIANIVDQIVALDQTQAVDLREYVKAIQTGEGTVHLEQEIWDREWRRTRLYLDLEEQTFKLSPERIASLDLKEIPRPRMADLLAKSDYSQPQPPEEREWVNAPPAGRESI